MTFSPAPLEVEKVLTPEWLSWALSQNRAPVKVKNLDVLETLGPSALKIRIKLDFDGPRPAEIPEQICIKGVFNPELKGWLVSGAQHTESFFYRHVAPELTVRVPQCVYTGVDHDNMNGVQIMENLIPKGVKFLSALSPYTPQQALGSLDQLARLHGGTWNLLAAKFDWCQPKLPWLAAGNTMPASRLTELMLQERGEVLPERIRSGERIYAALQGLVKRAEAAPTCLTHGDAHAGNVWEGPEGVGLVDWQVLSRGHWAMDVAYHMGAALDIEDRRANEKKLLQHYLDRLAVHGGTPPDWDTAWKAYCEHSAYGLFMWGITLRVDPPIIKQFVTRLGLAVADNCGFESLGV